MSHILYVDNTGYIQLEGYKNGLTNEYINDAVVTAELKDSEGNPIDGLLPTMVLTYQIGSNGNYSTVITEDAGFNVGSIVSAKVTALSSGIKSTFNCKVIIKERGC